MSRIDDVKVVLGIRDNLQDGLLAVLEKLTEDHFKAYTNQVYVPREFDFIITDVMVKRFNRVGAEGMESQSVEGLSQKFSLDDFKEYESLLDRHFKLTPEAGGGVRFI